MNEQNLIVYYNKFNEDKRLNTRHGQVEFITTLKYINNYLKKDFKIIDIGAGTGKYSKALYDEGYDVTAIELVKHNLRVIEKNYPEIKAYQGNALDLSKFNDNEFDIVLLFGPMYHLIKNEDKLKALNEAKRICKNNGYIFVAYCMNEYAVITHGFKENNILTKENEMDETYHIKRNETDLYSYMRIEDINKLNKSLNLERVKIITPDGPANYIRNVLNKMDDTTFNKFLDYHFATCERQDLIGAAAHTLDILKK